MSNEITEKIFEIIGNRDLSPDEIEEELRKSFGLISQEYSNAVMLAKSQEHFASLIADAVHKKFNPEPEPQPRLVDQMYPSCTREALNKRYHEWDENQSIPENLYPSLNKGN